MQNGGTSPSLTWSIQDNNWFSLSLFSSFALISFNNLFMYKKEVLSFASIGRKLKIVPLLLKLLHHT